MKIICKDNFDRETVDDHLVAENVSEYYGNRIVKMLNDKEGENSENYYKLVEDGYKLYKFEP